MIKELYCTTPNLNEGYYPAWFSCKIWWDENLYSFSHPDLVDLRGCNVRTHYEQNEGMVSLRTKDAVCSITYIDTTRMLICRPKIEGLIDALKNINKEYDVEEWLGFSENEMQRIKAFLEL